MIKTLSSVSYIYIRNFLLFTTIILLLLYSGLIWATEEEVVKPPPLIPIPLSDISAQASAEQAFISQSETLLERTSIINKIQDNLLVLEKNIAANRISLGASLAVASSREAIIEIEKQWLKIR